MPEPASTSGSIELGIITNVDTVKYRARVKYPLQGGSPQVCIINPAVSGGHMPEENTYCLILRFGRHYARYLMPLSKVMTEAERSLEDRLDQEEGVGDLPLLQPGESFIGHKAKMHFTANGDISMYTESSGLRFELNAKQALARLDANNYHLATNMDGIVIKTASSVSTTFGDKLRLEKNVPVPQLPPEATVGSVPTPPDNLSYIELDEYGGISAGVLDGGLLHISELGAVELSTLGGGLTVSPAGETVLKSEKNVSIEGLLAVSVTGNQKGFNVLLNAYATEANRRGVARVDDISTSDQTVDGDYWTYLTQVHAALVALTTAISSSPTTASDGGEAYKAGLVAAMATAPFPAVAPAKVLSKVTTGSTTVTAGG